MGYEKDFGIQIRGIYRTLANYQVFSSVGLSLETWNQMVAVSHISQASEA